jgi:hypothetical protein
MNSNSNAAPSIAIIGAGISGLTPQLHRAQPITGIPRGGRIHNLDLERPVASLLSTSLVSWQTKLRMLKLLPAMRPGRTREEWWPGGNLIGRKGADFVVVFALTGNSVAPKVALLLELGRNSIPGSVFMTFVPSRSASSAASSSNTPRTSRRRT